jgi:hypothetical protein
LAFEEVNRRLNECCEESRDSSSEEIVPDGERLVSIFEESNGLPVRAEERCPKEHLTRQRRSNTLIKTPNSLPFYSFDSAINYSGVEWLLDWLCLKANLSIRLSAPANQTLTVSNGCPTNVSEIPPAVPRKRSAKNVSQVNPMQTQIRFN